MKRVLLMIAGILALAAAPALLPGGDQWFSTLTQLTIEHVLAILALTGLFLISQGLLLRAAAGAFGYRLSFPEWFGLLVLTLFGNYFVPLSGIGLRAAYLKSRHRMDYSRFLTLTLGIYWAELAVFGAGGMAGLLLLPATPQTLVQTLMTLTSIGLLVLVLAGVWLPARPRWLGRFGGILKLTSAWDEMRANRRAMMQLIGLTLVEFGLYAAMLHVTHVALADGTQLASSLVGAYLSDYSYFIKLLPAGLGTLDASLAITSSLTGGDPVTGMGVATILRVSTMAWLIGLTPVFAYLLFGSWTRLSMPVEAGAQAKNFK